MLFIQYYNFSEDTRRNEANSKSAFEEKLFNGSELRWIKELLHCVRDVFILKYFILLLISYIRIVDENYLNVK